jgi:pimeloyl-ACP methyl ester carboxylesterase
LISGDRGRGSLDAEGVAFLSRGAPAYEEALWASVPYTYAEATRRRHADRIGEDGARRVEQRRGFLAHSHQLVAAAGHTALARLPEIAAPTLVVHGEQDAIVPAGNARLIADVIPRAELELSSAGGHLYMTDDPRIDHRIHRFLLCHTPERRTRAERLQRARGRLEAMRRRQYGPADAAERLVARVKRAAELR